jgi:hypothetical protein
MAFQYSVGARNAALDAIETAIGAAPTLVIRSGAMPADYATAATGTVLVTMVLPSDWANAAAAGAKTILGLWQDASADAAGTAGYFRIIGATNGMQGTVTATGGGGDMTLDNAVIAAGQQVTVTAFTQNIGGA